MGPSAFVVCCLYTRSDHRPQSGAVVRKAYPCYHTRNSIQPCLSGVPPRRCCSSNLRGGKSREARLTSMKVDVCCACPEVGPGPLQKATRDQTYLAHFFQGYSSLLLPVSLSYCSVRSELAGEHQIGRDLVMSAFRNTFDGNLFTPLLQLISFLLGNLSRPSA